MKISIVPAQVTTIEDRIAGSLSLNQLLLLIIPLFSSCALYFLLPPSMHNATYKLVLIVVLMLAGSIMAIRIRGKILLYWLVILTRYNLRPRYYIYNKQSLAARNVIESSASESSAATTLPNNSSVKQLPLLTVHQKWRIQNLIENPNINLTFKRTKRGGLRVFITEVKG